jgi:cell division protease FtsH
LGNARNFAFWIVLFVLMIMLFNMFSNSQGTSSARTVNYSDFVERVESGAVSRVTIDGERIVFVGRDGQQYTTIRPDDTTLTQRLLDADVPVEARAQQQSGFMSTLMLWLPFLLLIGVWIFFMNRMQGGGKGWCDGLWQVQGETADRKAWPRDL